MNILISGYGKMGKEIERLAPEAGHRISGVYNEHEEWDMNPDLLLQCDVVIDFSTPRSAEGNILRCFRAGKPIICGTTGWHENLPQITATCEALGGALFYAPNFSIGMNMYLEICERLALMMNQYPAYIPSLKEIHHTRKLDAPSGTALAIAARIVGRMEKLTGWLPGSSAPDHLMAIESVREGDVTGTHILELKGPADRIVLTHEAFNRSGFAMGALTAATWIAGRKGVYTMKDLLAGTNDN